MAGRIAKADIGDPASNITMGLIFILFGSLISIERFQAYFVVGGILLIVRVIYSLSKGSKGITRESINLDNIGFIFYIMTGIFLVGGIIIWFISQMFILIFENVGAPNDPLNDIAYGLAGNAVPFTYEMMKFGLIALGIALLLTYIIYKRNKENSYLLKLLSVLAYSG